MKKNQLRPLIKHLNVFKPPVVLAALLFWILPLTFLPNTAFGWGERGHQTVARVAVKLLAERAPKALHGPFKARMENICHLANIPDISWKSLEGSVTSVQNPSHWINLEYFNPTPSLKSVPTGLMEAFELLKKDCETNGLKDKLDCKSLNGKGDAFRVVGSAPWRINQLTQNIKGGFAELKKTSGNKTASSDTYNERINTIILYFGVMAHYVGDLGQPLHATRDYDGWLRDQGGLHEYFETAVVDEMDLDLDQKVYEYALANAPAKKIVLRAKSEVSYLESDFNAVTLALALSLESFDRASYLMALDQKNTFLKPSMKNEKGRTAAQRKPPKEGVPVFKDLIIERLAFGADALAYLLENAWAKGGSPDLSDFNGGDYHFNPQLIPIDYL